MTEVIKSMALAEEAIINKIFLIRDQKVMIDSDLAELYGVETKRLKER
jgi:ORF6N domain